MSLRLVLATLFASLTICFPQGVNAEDDNRPLWLRYPSISPDGSQIAFCYGGKIWVVPAEGGDATPLTEGTFYARYPVWSPDGKRIAFASKRHGNEDIFIMPVAGGPIQRLTYYSGGDLPTSFSPDGKKVYFSSPRISSPQTDGNDDLTGAGLPQNCLIEVSSNGGRPRMVLPTPTLEAVWDQTGKRLLYVNHPAPFENEWRKHQVSGAARDVWLYDATSNNHKPLTTWRGEDRNPVWSSDGQSMLWLSERSGSFNVWRRSIEGGEPEQVTRHKKWPVRFLSSAKDGSLAYSWGGELWRLKAGEGEPESVPVRIRQGSLQGGVSVLDVAKQATDFSVSADGTQAAVIARGEVFVVSLTGGGARRISNTPALERYIDFAPDGRRLVYASERNGTWDIIEARLVNKEDKTFSGAAPVEEVVLVGGDEDTYKPLYSPKGDRIAYLHERTALRVLDMATGKSVEVLPGDAAYSYNDGDMEFAWSPNGRWLITQTGFFHEVEIVDAAGQGKRQNVSLNGFYDLKPQVSADGQIALWLSDRKGLKSTTGQPDQMDVYAGFFTREALAQFREGKGADASNSKQESEEAVPPVNGIERRTIRLTPFSSNISYFRLSPDNKRLITVVSQQNGTTVCYVIDARTRAVRTIFTRPGSASSYETDEKVTALYELGAGSISKYDLSTGKKSVIPFKAEMERNAPAEIAGIFQSNWRMTGKTFYDPKMHGVDWNEVGDHYRQFLTHITQWEDFTELECEMVGELNASHQGAAYAKRSPTADSTAVLGLYYDENHRGAGMKIDSVLEGGPADRPSSDLKPGAVILSVNGEEITPQIHIHQLLNRKAGQEVRLEIQPANGGKVVVERIKPVSLPVEISLVYERWIATRRALVEKLSDGRIGYIHVLSMKLGPYQRAYGELFGRYRQAEAVIVDIRSNGGGNIHDQLNVMLTGNHDSDKVSRQGTVVDKNPIGRWARPSALLVNSNSYSDGSVYPLLYQVKKTGPIIGSPVPGTGTAVVRPPQIDPHLSYGIPEMGFRLTDERFFENLEIKPNVEVYNDPNSVAAGKDLQLEAAVDVLMKQLGRRQR